MSGLTSCQREGQERQLLPIVGKEGGQQVPQRETKQRQGKQGRKERK